ncbi:MAG: hypothetical protein Kow0097_07790 [Candidatus Bipolaricaulota bacterium]|uniref:Uncharacterized protein n=1 Tax=Bipolaricaulis sibiricus TaxID=2501609 RepID=A0A410FSH4_BIPS1|nr:MAG: hypothetical protein BIP78_0205 [Candidatus Bipolaricaulis sibiricus]
MYVRSDRTVRTPKELWRTLVLALALSVLLFVWSVVVLPAVSGEARSQRLVLYWAVASPIAGTVVAVVIRAVGRRWPGRAPARPRSTRAIVLRSLAFGAPGALGVMLLWVIPREVTLSDLVWWRVAGWIATFVGLTIAIGFLGGVLPELTARWGRRKRAAREDEADPKR